MAWTGKLLSIGAAAALAAGGGAALAASSPGASPGAPATIYGCVRTGGTGFSKNVIFDVSVTAPPACPAGSYAVNWQGNEGTATPSPSPSSPSVTPAPSPTTVSPGPSPTTPPPSSSPPPGGCTVTGPSVTCGPYRDAAITMSNGYDTYDATDCWADPSCTYVLTGPPVSGTSATPWQVVASEPAGQTGVASYPDEAQLLNDWCGSGWNTCDTAADTPLSGLASLSSSYSETMPHNAGTGAEAAWDIWLSGNGTGNSTEVMVWVDNVNRGSGGAAQLATYALDGQQWTLYQYGGAGGELIWSLGGPGTFENQGTGTVDLLSLMNELVTLGYEGSGSAFSSVDFGWEICSTGGGPETFTLSSYSLTAAAK